jgi:nucleoside-diphosphate-sugar epimerase
VHVLVAGAGWLGSALSRTLAARGHRVTAVRRDPARAAALASPGVEPLALDLAAPGAAAGLPRGLEAARSGGRPAALVYTGSTGVFGQRDGSEVDEETPPAPASASAEVLVEAERLVLGASGEGLRSMVLRLSGLYGPGRTWPVDRVRGGQMALGPGDGTWLNLCHLDDAVASVVATLERGSAGRTYHASDTEPVRRRDLIAWVASRLGIPAPRQPEGARAPSLPDRRVRADRSRADLGIVLRHPTFRDGLGI